MTYHRFFYIIDSQYLKVNMSTKDVIYLNRLKKTEMSFFVIKD